MMKSQYNPGTHNYCTDCLFYEWTATYNYGRMRDKEGNKERKCKHFIRCIGFCKKSR